MTGQTGKPKDQHEYETENTIQPTLTDRLNKYLLCVYLDRLNEEDSDSHSGSRQFVSEDDAADTDTEEAFTD
ncbi:unnamed protein product [Macrosiphum euphorbiae]|uniref:Uncharacterized protein n=1 Tax=Macrosiphum euphorbiae TaxID=13131 RepID=A0AAV0VT64_9HEMI|nr:unnamed protein product [Macrosiphum euphorbiae]